MARPIVLVYQELAQTSSTPATPTLPAMIVGPAYTIKDYPDDASEILLTSTYGTLNTACAPAPGYNPPLAGVTAIDVTTYPGNTAGAIVDHDSVRVFLKTPRVILGTTYIVPTAIIPRIESGGLFTAETVNTAGNENKVIFAAGVDLATTYGIQAGDIVVITDNSGTPVTLVRTVLSVGEGGTALNVLRVTQNFPTSGWTFSALATARVERTLATQELIDTTGAYIYFPTPTENELTLRGGIYLDVVIGSSTVQRAVSYSQVYLAYRSLRQDLQRRDSCTIADYLTKLGKFDARNPLCVGARQALLNAGTVPVNFFGVSSDDATGYLDARAKLSAYRDLYAFVPLTMDQAILYAYKVEHSSMADPTVAGTTGVVQKFRIGIGGQYLPTAETVSAISTEGVAYQSGAPTVRLYRTATIAAPVVNISTALPGSTVTIGIVPAGGNWSTRRGVHYLSHCNTTTGVELLPGNTTWDDAGGDACGAADGVEIRVSDTHGTLIHERLARLASSHGTATWTIYHRNPVTSGLPYSVAFVAGAPGCACTATILGLNITITFDLGVHTVADGIAAVAANPDVDAVVTSIVTGSAAQNLAAAVSAPLAITKILSEVTITQNDTYYDILQDAGATFLTDGVIPGDLLQIPSDPNNYTSTAFDSNVSSWVIDEVISENRVKILPVSDDTPTTATELPHGYSRSGSGAIDNTAPTAQNYRVLRSMTKDEQVTALSAISGSFLDKRATLVWPDLAVVNGLVDGSLTRADPATPEAAPAQPSMYLACAVAGCVSGLPAQYGLTNLSIAGFDTLVHSTDWFTDYQLTRISDAGWYVFQQDSEDSAPYCIHQLTTDPTAVETGELSVVKTFDYDSMQFMLVLDPFIGRYNVLDDTISEIERVLKNTGNLLMRSKIARFGAPLTSMSITSLAVSSISTDRVEVYISLGIPRPLNRIGLHLVV